MELDLFETPDPVVEVLEYARLHGLCRDYLTDQLSFHDIVAPSDQELEADLDDLMHISITDPDSKLTKERLAVNKDAALLLKAIHSLQQQHDVVGSTIPPRTRSSLLKQEVPLLRSDHELDVHAFGDTKIPSLNTVKIPLETIDNENDEGLEWPSSYQKFTSLCDRELKHEKISIPKDVLVYLQDAVRNTWSRQDSEDVIAAGLGYQRAKSTNSTAAELREIEDQVMKDDALAPPLNMEQSDDFLLLGGTETTTFDVIQDCLELDLSRAEKRKVDGLRIEGPLTPPMFTESPLKKLKSVSFPEMLHEYIPVLPSIFESGNDVLSSQDDFAAFFEPYAEQANKMVAREKLSEADTTKRVDVPDLDFTLPTAPWTEFSRKANAKHPSGETELEAQMKFLLQMKREELNPVSSWHGLTSLERNLHWSPFPSSWATVKIEEKLHGDDVFSKLLSELEVGDVITSSTDLWKRDGLRVLEVDDDSDDELEPAEYEGCTTVESLVRKRKFEIDEEDYGAITIREPPPSNPPISNRDDQVARRNRPRQGQQLQETAKTQPILSIQKELDSSLMFGGMFSASTALHKFMAVNGKQPLGATPGTVASQSEFLPAKAQVPLSGHIVSRNSEQDQHPEPTSAVQEVEMRSRARPMDLPPLPESLQPCSFILSSTLLQQRNLAREIEKSYPHAELMERDFSLPHSSAQEADLLLSPSTGLILTTLQQIKQRALPGQRERSPIKQRCIHLQHRYERLVVLISEGLSKDSELSGACRPGDKRDEEALADFDDFTSTMDAEVLNEYVRGGEKAVARATIIQMARWGLPYGSKDVEDLRLLQDETHWELFLRRAGLNPFAAQMLLASLKEPYDLPIRSSSPMTFDASGRTLKIFGLPAFLLMSPDERIQRFQALLGGSRILNRTNHLIEQQWISAAHGFAL
ncbi:hypothetical protein K491DRAFT_735318 [Lophiostoma macrostomum CBS 122681]|uniref:Uncharacterized protein n=1 Tax=Lophiostoma macrostomum CBS 122681 TaxID=1314788 RepID=A0A6A6SQI0_9PLEO|nr:hypothetical protein K491DRAFT_735318 [Lophiostoma macrostomum CBS 122681]